MTRLVFLVGLGIAAAVAGQGDPAEGRSGEFEAQLARLTLPPDKESVMTLVRHPRTSQPEAALSLVVHLTQGGGHAGASGLLVLMEHTDAKVRAAALTAFADLGMRMAGEADRVRQACRDLEIGVRTAAIAALGVVGTAVDVPDLLATLAESDQRVQAAGYRALRALSGLKLPYQQRQWTYWWSQAPAQLTKRIGAAIARLERGGAEADVLDARRALAQSAWFDPKRVSEAAERWLLDRDPRLRMEGYRLAAGARLGDLAGAFADALREEREPEAVAIGSETARILGIKPAVPAGSPPSAVREGTSAPGK